MKRKTIEKKMRISIHALRGEGDNNFFNRRLDIFISIHALRGEGDGHMPRGWRER